ncbi:MAG: CRISPR-associated endonuclease Cas2 [Lachnospiraceae bacterium]|jgi:CRISPR-associated protein Cas2|nr:CRISPR-associated endonuclease Cas2 [Lachnospiraceae bacterium]
MYVILVYDIKMDDEGSKIWRNTFKICKRYLIHIQNSVFEGDLTKVQITSLQMELKKYIRKDKDSVILFKSRDAKWLEREMWGIQEDLTSRFL